MDERVSAKRDDRIAKFLVASSLAVAAAAILATGLHAQNATHAATTVTVYAGKPSEFRFQLSVKTVKVGKVTFKVTNKGSISHDFKMCAKGGLANTCSGKVTPLLAPKKSATLVYTFTKAGSYEYLCTVPGHAAAGMKGDLKVTN